jgi:hypothetical protein
MLRILPAGFSPAQEAGSKPEVRRGEGQRQTGFVFGHDAESCFKLSQTGMGLPRLGGGFECRGFPVAGVALELPVDVVAVPVVLRRTKGAALGGRGRGNPRLQVVRCQRSPAQVAAMR